VVKKKRAYSLQINRKWERGQLTIGVRLKRLKNKNIGRLGQRRGFRREIAKKLGMVLCGNKLSKLGRTAEGQGQGQLSEKRGGVYRKKGARKKSEGGLRAKGGRSKGMLRGF